MTAPGPGPVERAIQHGYVPSFTPHPLVETALTLALPAGPMLDLACGPSGSALAVAASGRPVTAVDVSDVALRLLAGEAMSRGLAGLITAVHADLATWRPEPASYAVVLCSGYWDRAVFAAAGAGDGRRRAGLGGIHRRGQARAAAAPAEWCLRPGEPASLLPSAYGMLIDKPADRERGRMRQLLARRVAAAAS